MKFKIWDKHNKQFLEPMAVFFGEEDTVWKVTAKKYGDNALTDGWYDLQGQDLAQIQFLRYTGLKVRGTLDILEGSIFQYTKQPKYLLDDFVGQVVWMAQYACFGYIVKGKINSFPTAFSEHDELETDILNHIRIIGNVFENPELMGVAV